MKQRRLKKFDPRTAAELNAAIGADIFVDPTRLEMLEDSMVVLLNAPWRRPQTWEEWNYQAHVILGSVAAWYLELRTTFV